MGRYQKLRVVLHSSRLPLRNSTRDVTKSSAGEWLMKRFNLVFAAMLLAPFLFSPVRTQVNGNLAGAISQLLDHPAPPPPPPKDLAEVLSALEEAVIKAGADDPPDPGDDAPIRVLIYYWERQVRGGMGKQPSEKVSQRLLLACEEGPVFSPNLLYFLPNTPDADARIK